MIRKSSLHSVNHFDFLGTKSSFTQLVSRAAAKRAGVPTTQHESQHASLSHPLINSGIEIDVQVLERIGRNLAREGDRAERGRHTHSE